MTTHEKLIFLREHGMTLRYIAKRAECSPQVLTNWANGNVSISARLEKCIKEAMEAIIEEIGGCK